MFHDGTTLTCLTETKLFGVTITDDLKWQKNTEYICQKARKNIWLLRRMKSLILSTNQMFDVRKKEIRSIVKMAVPVWHAGLTKNLLNEFKKSLSELFLTQDTKLIQMQSHY